MSIERLRLKTRGLLRMRSSRCINSKRHQKSSWRRDVPGLPLPAGSSYGVNGGVKQTPRRGHRVSPLKPSSDEATEDAGAREPPERKRRRRSQSRPPGPSAKPNHYPASATKRRCAAPKSRCRRSCARCCASAYSSSVARQPPERRAVEVDAAAPSAGGRASRAHAALPARQLPLVLKLRA